MVGPRQYDKGTKQKLMGLEPLYGMTIRTNEVLKTYPEDKFGCSQYLSSLHPTGKNTVKYLLDNLLAPVTFRWGFVEAPLAEVERAYVKWVTGLGFAVESVAARGNLGEALRLLEPLTNLRWKEIIIGTSTTWTSLFDDGIRGGDPHSTVATLCKTLHCRGLTIRCIPSTKKVSDRELPGVYGVVSFTLFADHETDWLNQERAVEVIEDGGVWSFAEGGVRQPFEELENYDDPVVTNRLTPEMLERYCSALGIRLFDPSFYGPEGFLISRTNPLPPNTRSASLEEARRLVGL
jgi:hypothetical protein